MRYFGFFLRKSINLTKFALSNWSLSSVNSEHHKLEQLFIIYFSISYSHSKASASAAADRWEQNMFSTNMVNNIMYLYTNVRHFWLIVWMIHKSSAEIKLNRIRWGLRYEVWKIQKLFTVDKIFDKEKVSVDLPIFANSKLSFCIFRLLPFAEPKSSKFWL